MKTLEADFAFSGIQVVYVSLAYLKDYPLYLPLRLSTVKTQSGEKYCLLHIDYLDY